MRLLLSLVLLLGWAFDARAGEQNNSGLKFLLRRIQIPIVATEAFRSSAFVGFDSANLDPSFAGLTQDFYLGRTSVGAFAWSIDFQASLVNSGPGLRLNWYWMEGFTPTFRIDPLRGGLSISIRSEPGD